ncbi:tetratricopeptide repeat protein [Sphingopyxis solisilvae]|uniref:tetratricopeptide repeat protein n=1 Tax=Sphingopyxis solisilvae TaxID=1886788 RepID=UPI0018929FA9|nr:tetratricopeptide repeat protein [Sphingopyxis solisilvae]
MAIPEDQWSESLSLISAPKIAVAYLSDRRFEDFWPLLVRFGGEDGGKLIEAVVATRKERAAAIPRGPGSGDTLLSALGQASRAAVAEARILSALGLTPEANELLERTLPQPDRKGRYNKRKSFEWIAVSMTRAASLHNAGHPEDAIEIYRKMEQNDAIAAEYRLNAVINRAALLAELGQGAAALELIEPAARQFVVSPGDARIAGSMRQFDWIRGCALHSLGRSDEAQRVVSGIFSTPRPSSADFFVPAGRTLEARYRWCIGDLAWLNGEFRKELEQPFAPAAAVNILYGKTHPYPQHQQMTNAIRSQFRSPETIGRLREPPPGWRDLLDSDKLAVRARAIIASAPR